MFLKKNFQTKNSKIINFRFDKFNQLKKGDDSIIGANETKTAQWRTPWPTKRRRVQCLFPEQPYPPLAAVPAVKEMLCFPYRFPS